MKKFVFMASLLFASYSAIGQGFYGDINVGYGLGYPGRIHNDGTGLGTSVQGTIDRDGVSGVVTQMKNSDKSINGGVGQGLNLQITPGYMFNDHIGVELGINYYLGSRVTVQEVNYDLHAHVSIAGMSDELDVEDYVDVLATSKSQQMRLIPSLVLSTGASKNISGYAKFGLVLPVFGSSTVSMDRTDKTVVNSGFDFVNGKITYDEIAETKTSQEQVINGSFTVGFKGAMGINFKVAEKISVFAEVFATNLQIDRKKAELTKFEIGGVDQLPNMTTYQKEITYVNELSNTSNSAEMNPDFTPGSAREALKMGTNFNQLGLAVGVKFNF